MTSVSSRKVGSAISGTLCSRPRASPSAGRAVPWDGTIEEGRMSLGRGALAGALLAWMLTGAPVRADAPPASDAGTVVVQLADGSTVPLQDWTFSYEYVAWKKGTSLAQAQPTRRDSHDLWLGKRQTPVSGAVVELQYRDEERVHDD